MTPKNLGIAVCVTVWTYLVLTLFLGDKGLVAHAGLEGYRADLEIHVEQLSRIQDELSASALRLRTDPEQIRIESRRIGYIRPEEGIIRISGRQPIEQPLETPGDKLGSHPRWRADATFLRVLALSMGLLAFFLLQTIFRASR